MCGTFFVKTLLVLLWKQLAVLLTQLGALFVIIFLTPALMLFLLTLHKDESAQVKIKREAFQEMDAGDISGFEAWYKQTSNTMAPNALQNFHLKYLAPKNFVPNIGLATSGLKFSPAQAYESSSKLQRALLLDEGRTAFAGVEFKNATEPNITVTLRFPAMLRTFPGMNWLTDRLIFDDGWDPRSALHKTLDRKETYPVPYWIEGFIPLYYYVALKPYLNKHPLYSLQHERYVNLEEDESIQVIPYDLSKSFCYLFCIGFLYPCVFLTQEITSERERQQKRVLLMMGVQNILVWLSWFVKYIILFGCSFVLVVIVLAFSPAQFKSLLSQSLNLENDTIPIAPRAMLVGSDLTLTFFHLLVFGATVICSCFLLSVLTRNDVQAELATLLFIASGFIIYFWKECFGLNVRPTAKKMQCLLPGAAVSYGMETIFHYENRSEKHTWTQIYKNNWESAEVSVGFIWNLMLVEAALCLLICLYAEQVFYTPRPWYFPLDYRFWCPFMPRKNEVIPTRRSLGGAERKADIETKNLRKHYGYFEAVKPLNMKAYRNEITVIVGPKGSGKTTIVSMLACVLPPSSGTAMVHGYNIRKLTSLARDSIGFCPQFNVLYDDLSARNHILLYSGVKGWSPALRYFNAMDLKRYKGHNAADLSIDIKRQLLLSCAFASGSKIVLCDEPTSGVSPGCKHKMWQFLESEKKGRTILVTTQSIDEAKAIGDQIAVLNDGELKYMGTPAELRDASGAYKLIFIKCDRCDGRKINAFLRTYFADLAPGSHQGNKIVYEVPQSSTHIFPKMFQSLEDNARELRIASVEVRHTTKADSILYGKKARTNKESMIRGRYNQVYFPVHESWHIMRHLSQWQAMFLKMYFCKGRYLFWLLALIFLPLLIFSATADLLPTPILEDLPPMEISLDSYQSKVMQTMVVRKSNVQVMPIRGQVYWGFQADCYYDRWTLGNCYLHSNPKTWPSDTIDYHFDPNDRFSDFQRRKILGYFYFWKYFGGISVYNATSYENQISIGVNNIYIHTTPLAYLLCLRTIVNYFHVDADLKPLTPLEIRLINAPLPYALDDRLKFTRSYYHYMTLPLLMAMAFTVPLYILFPSHERVVGSKMLQFLAGVNAFVFWFSHLMWDLSIYIVSLVLLYITMICLQLKEYPKDYVDYFFDILLIFGLASILLAYVCSGFMPRPWTGYALLCLINLACFLLFFAERELEQEPNTLLLPELGMLLPIIPMYALCLSVGWLRSETAKKQTCEEYTLLTQEERCQVAEICCTGESGFKGLPPNILQYVLYMVAVSAVLFILLLLWDSKMFRFITHFCMCWKRMNLFRHTGAGNVAREKRRIAQMEWREVKEHTVVADEMSKNFACQRALKPISFCTKARDCFGILGPGASGKTTAIRTLAGDIWVTGGIVYICGLNISTQLRAARRKIGYMPQHDAHLNVLSVRETLAIFSLLRGIKQEIIQEYVELLCVRMAMTQIIDERIESLSRSERRLVSYAVAMIDGPSVILLDEPTAGIASKTRRFIWDEIVLTRNMGTSYVLATSSAKECEYLCTEMAIMQKGKFVLLGTPQELKSSYCNAFFLEITLISPTDKTGESNLISKIKQLFPGSVPRMNTSTVFTFYVPLKSMTWSDVFKILESEKRALNFAHYTVSQVELDDMFMISDPQQHELNNRKRQCGGCCTY